MTCPKCGQEQYCPCPVCRKQHKRKDVWVELPNDIIACVKCGHKMHIDYWSDNEMKQLKIVKYPKGIPKNKCFSTSKEALANRQPKHLSSCMQLCWLLQCSCLVR